MFYKEYLLLILICSVILTGCHSEHSEEKDFVRRNKPRIDAEIDDLKERVANFLRQEEDFLPDNSTHDGIRLWGERRSKVSGFLQELDKLRVKHTENHFHLVSIGVE